MVFPEPRAWQLTVTGVNQLSPRMRAITLASRDLNTFAWLPGQDVALAFTATDGGTVRRRYSIRRFDPDRRLLEINVVMHGDGPGMRWAQTAQPGMTIDAIAPRGKITLAADASSHFFAGDASALPAAFAMMEALPAQTPALAVFLVDDQKERQALLSRTIRWSYGSGDLLAAIREATPPLAGSHAYLAGEVALVSSLKTALIADGWTGEQISAKAYWNQGRANADRGEPEQKLP